MKIIKRLVCVAGLFAITGCKTLGIGAGSNSGQIEYRIAEPVPVTEAMISNEDKNRLLPRGKLIRKYSGSENHFNSTTASDTEKDVYSIILEQAVIGEFVGEAKYFQPAEIAILANAFEFDEVETSDASSRFYEFPELVGPMTTEGGSQTDVSDGMKLIYFSPDVFLKQPLNFSALPIIPPTKYNGRPVGIQIAILELDKMSGPLKSLLSELAELGRKSGVASTAPVIGDVALDLGSALLDGNVNNDDVVFEYRMVLYPQQLSTSTSANGKPYNETATFQPGRYVLLRSEYRNNTIDWDNLELDHNTTRLYSNEGEVRDKTYMVMNIVKHAAGTPEAYYAHRTYGQLNDIIVAAEQTNGSASLDTITKTLSERVKLKRSKAWLEELNLKWALLRTEMESLEQNRYPEKTDGTGIVNVIGEQSCTLVEKSVLRPPLVRAEIKVKNAATDFISSYKRSITPDKDTANPDIKDADRDALLRRISLYVIPNNESLSSSLQSALSFKTSYVTAKSGVEFGDAMIQTVNKIPRTITCDELRARGWAKPLSLQ